MRKRSRLRSNLQSRAFDLYNKGYSLFAVAEKLDITIGEARRYHQIFLQAEDISPDRKKKITEFLEQGFAEERRKLIDALCSDLPEARKKMVREKEVRVRSERLDALVHDLEFVLLFFIGIEIPVQISQRDDVPFLIGLKKVLDNKDKVCLN